MSTYQIRTLMLVVLVDQNRYFRWDAICYRTSMHKIEAMQSITLPIALECL
jgi:hypothetical protein